RRSESISPTCKCSQTLASPNNLPTASPRNTYHPIPPLPSGEDPSEAAIWQFGKVRTPTHVVGGGSDVRVYVGEDYLLERALHARGIPGALLIFPGEGHGIGNNPWHGKIKVREELKWLDHYCKP
ncbi:MAG TPA: prolyl oligopeptidase family serine peptidase, partial [Terriglobia bacterium]|nr:prolyl oligopeptidase family serine peptidase [Terriglobia bacterium]